MTEAATVVKVGGSLFDLPNLRERLRSFLKSLDASAVLLIPGGGRATDVIRDLDRRHSLGEEASHWLALRSLSLNAHVLAELLSPARVVHDLHDSRTPGCSKREGEVPAEPASVKTVRL